MTRERERERLETGTSPTQYDIKIPVRWIIIQAFIGTGGTWDQSEVTHSIFGIIIECNLLPTMWVNIEPTIQHSICKSYKIKNTAVNNDDW